MQKGMNYLNNILSENTCSSNVLPDMLKAIGNVRTTMLRSSTISKKGNRPKRSMDLVSAMSGGGDAGMSESIASTLLVAYDLLVSKNQNVVTVYLSNLVDLLTGFCVETDSTKIKSASGQNYTTIQLQGLIPSYKTFLSTEYSLAGTDGKTIVFDKEFQRSYNNWACADKMNCSEICLGSAQVKFSVLQVNDFMAAYFSTSSYSAVGLSQLVSDLYEVVFMDPVTGKQVFLTDGTGFTVRIPLLAYKPSYYYKCYTFTGNAWVSNFCRSANYGITINSNVTALECTCNSGGFIGVFSVAPPFPISYPQYNEINITMKLTTTSRCTPDDSKTFVLGISQATNLDKNRFVNTNCMSGGFITTILRPPFRQNQTSNSYAIQSIKKAILAPNGFVAYDSIMIVNLTDSIIYRNLTNDGNARRVALRIDRSFKDLVGNDSVILAQSWISNIANNMRISPYRFKSPVLATGMVYNFTITVPFAGETTDESKLSAEEIADWISEQTSYGELDLRDAQNERMPIEQINPDEDIIELMVVTHITALMTVLASVVTIICVLTAFCIGGLVFVKIRTDRLIEKHNRNMRPLDISHAVPMTVLPYESEPLHVSAMNENEEVRFQHATETVVFRKNKHG
ncbi:Endoribonuclease [Aphelenchoides bicaudatus]|nr:Endoribonuclease [Aphelenchoides bicaudatus]